MGNIRKTCIIIINTNKCLGFAMNNYDSEKNVSEKTG